MSIAVQAEPQTLKWTREQFYELANQGWFIERNVELVDGEIVEMPPQGPFHYGVIDKAARTLEGVFGAGYWVRTQAPLALPGISDPNPDVSIVRGSREDYLEQHPTTALLVVEVSDSTLRYDRGRKASVYARAGIEDYWIINVADRRLEVRRNPSPDRAQPLGFGYSSTAILSPGEFVGPLALANVQIAVVDLLP